MSGHRQELRSLARRTGFIRSHRRELIRGVEMLESRRLLAVEQLLIADINPSVVPVNRLEATQFVDVAGITYFAAQTPETGNELWRTDGTPSGTRMLRDIFPGNRGSNITGLTNVNGTLFFSAQTDESGTGLWKSNGTAAGTTPVKVFTSAAQSLINIQGTLFFSAQGELWKSSGTAAGTVQVKDLHPTGDSNPQGLANHNGTLFFSADDGVNGRELWRSNGSAAGTVRVSDINPTGDSNPSWITSTGAEIFFSASDGVSGGLWKTNGVAAPQQMGTQVLGATGLTAIGDVVYFAGTTGVGRYSDEELWRSDGTVAGTYMVKHINPGTWPPPLGTNDPASSYPEQLVNFNGTLVFLANDTVGGNPSLWSSDGTEAGTVKISNSFYWMDQLVRVGDSLYCTSVGGNFKSLWRTDGTAAGTVPTGVGNIGWDFTNYPALQTTENRLYFQSADPEYGLFASDGTPGGTVRLDSQLTYGNSSGSSYSNTLAEVNGTVFFAAGDPSSGAELWKSNGKPGGTTQVADINPGSGSGGPSRLVNVGGLLYFTADDGANGRELWRSNGSAGGTIRLSDIAPGSASSNPEDFTNVNGTLFFTADSGSGRELYKSNGTPGGTTLVKDIHPTGGSDPQFLINMAGTLLFSADDGVNGRELWRSSGTAAGTQMVLDLNPTGSSSPKSLVVLNDRLLFGAMDKLWRTGGTAASTVELAQVRPNATVEDDDYRPNDRRRFIVDQGTVYFSGTAGGDSGLWKTNGTPAGTTLVHSINPFGFTAAGNLVFFYSSETGPIDLWRTNGTTAGTIELDPDPTVELWHDLPTWGLPASVNGEVYFLTPSSESGPYNFELWKSDGSVAGTVMVKDIVAGPGGSYPAQLVNSNGMLYFTTRDQFQYVLPGGLFRSDGTVAGTGPVASEIGSGPQRVNGLQAIGSQLYYWGYTDAFGQELYRLNTEPVIASFGGTRSYTENGAPLVISVGATLTDADSASFAGGRAIATLTANATAADRLSISPGGSITLSGSQVLHGGVAIGTFSGGTGATALTINFNGQATPARVQDLLRRIAFHNVSETPSTNNRTVSVQIRDGDGLASTTVTKSITVASVVDPPRIVSFGGNVTYVEGGSRLPIASSNVDVVVVEPRGFKQLTVALLHGATSADRLTIRAAGNLSISGNQIKFAGVTFGTYSGGSGSDGDALIVLFNAQATEGKIEALLRNIVFSNVSDKPSNGCPVSATLFDGGSYASPSATKWIFVTPVNDPPVLGGITGTASYLNSAPPLQIASTATVSDLDSPNFELGKLTVRITSGADLSNRIQLGGTVFTINAQNELLRSGVVIGTVNANAGHGLTKFEVTFNAQALPGYVQQLIRALRFRTTSSASTASRTIAFALTDGDGGAATASKTINVS